MKREFTRRQVLIGTSLGLLATSLPRLAFGGSSSKAKPSLGFAKENTGDWKTWKFKLAVTPAQSEKALLIPIPMQRDLTYQRPLSISTKGNFESAEIVRDPQYRCDALLVKFAQDTKKPEFEMTATVQTRDRSAPEPLSKTEDLSVYLKPTRHMPTDGLVKEQALKIAKGLKSADAKALAFHNWIIDNTFRDPKIKGCGIGDINSMLATGNLGGKCADLNALFVGFCRAAGIPAREVYGIRVGPSAQFNSLGKTGDISKGQHCRAEYYSEGKGWIAVDPADVRKVVLEEKLEVNDPKVQALRQKLFGFWEMNWIAYNTARDFTLEPFERELNYLMYPQSLSGNLSSLDPDQFKYSIETVG